MVSMLDKVVDALGHEDSLRLKEMMIKREAGMLLCGLVERYASTLTVGQSKHIVEAACKVLSALMAVDKNVVGEVHKECGCRAFVVLLRAFGKNMDMVVVLCDILRMLEVYSRSTGACGRIELLVSLGIRNGRNTQAHRAVLELLHTYCLLNSNADVLAKIKTLGALINSCRRKTSSRCIACWSTKIAVLLTSRSQKACMTLSRTKVVPFVLDVLSLFPQDCELVGQCLTILERVPWARASVSYIKQVNGFKIVYPILPRHLGNESLSSRLCCVLWKLHCVGREDEMDLNQRVEGDIVSLFQRDLEEEEGCFPTSGCFDHLLESSERAPLGPQDQDRKLGILLDFVERIRAADRHPSLVYDLKQGVSCTNGISFESRFESGNLARVETLGPSEYLLYLRADTSHCGQVQWFYFCMQGLDPEREYHFNIVNLEKPDSMYNYGMQPLVFCPRTARACQRGWTRVGSNIAYFANPFEKDCDVNGSKRCYSASLSFRLPKGFLTSSEDRVFMAYCFPYTYSNLVRDLEQLESYNFVRQETLCKTMGGTDCPLLTITNFDFGEDGRPYVFLSARVHPGETNASYTMRGALRFLCSNEPAAVKLRDRVIFKIVPMLNPDGVIHGNHRSNLAGLDLNRQWSDPCKDKSPTVFHLKALMRDKDVKLFVDMHGHSRMDGIFLYGCEDCKTFGVPEQVFPHLVDRVASPQVFSLDHCTYRVTKGKVNCARVAVWRDLKISHSYTLESSFCGKGDYHFNALDFEELGGDTMRAVWDLVDPQKEVLDSVTRLLETKFPDRFLSVPESPVCGTAVEVEDDDDREEGNKKRTKKKKRGRTRKIKPRRIRRSNQLGDD
eukprot:CAMPEP_0203787624 /NCGR_PEP_ID=MMETSP0100_2-20121128/2352_1 /ASSEMBLY_ACC=CAM_ASM_000210 /TAXON_ID=96639 /ORGANISM=" , Strain NY0313808BC1" /LENGTH=842 /DNA_ID=CAMNT_0050690191 /DNA_START=146 /DNA_END=2674 /DNA_ORIENTATION=-